MGSKPNIFKQAKDILIGLEKVKEPEYDWRDNRKGYLKTRRQQMLPSNRKCPVCGKVKLRSRQWIVMGNKVSCRSCWLAIKRCEVRFTFDPVRLTVAREMKCFSQKEFAEMAGWSQPYQSRLEAGEVKTISESTAKVLQALLGNNLVSID